MKLKKGDFVICLKRCSGLFTQHKIYKIYKIQNDSINKIYVEKDDRGIQDKESWYFEFCFKRIDLKHIKLHRLLYE